MIETVVPLPVEYELPRTVANVDSDGRADFSGVVCVLVSTYHREKLLAHTFFVLVQWI